MSRQLKPYRQGELDGLCGPYSVVNAIRFAIHTLRTTASSRPPGQLDDDKSERLFLHLIDNLTVGGVSTRFFIEGVGQAQVTKLLRSAGDWLYSRRALRLSFKCPLRRGLIDTSALLNHVGLHLSKTGTAAIIAGNEPWRHWTVATKVTRSRLLLFDSEGDDYVFIDAGPRKRVFHAGLLRPPDLYLLTLSLQERDPTSAGRRRVSKRSATGKTP